MISADSYDIDKEFDILLLSDAMPEIKPATVSFHGHNEIESPINLWSRNKSGITPSTNIHLFKTDNNLNNKSIVSNASSIIPCSADSFVIIGEEQLSSLLERTNKKSLLPILEIAEKEGSSESGQSNSFTKDLIKLSNS